MALRNRSRLRYPQARRLIHWILALVASDRAFVTFGRTASITPSQCRLIAHARATRNELVRSGGNVRRCRYVPQAGQTSVSPTLHATSDIAVLEGQPHIAYLPRALDAKQPSVRAVSVIRPVYSGAGRSCPAITSSEPARATSHPKDRSDGGGDARRLDSPGTEATLRLICPHDSLKTPPSGGALAAAGVDVDVSRGCSSAKRQLNGTAFRRRPATSHPLGAPPRWKWTCRMSPGDICVQPPGPEDRRPSIAGDARGAGSPRPHHPEG